MFTQLHYRGYDARLQDRERKSFPHRVVGNTWLWYDTPATSIVLRQSESAEAVLSWVKDNLNVHDFAWRVLDDTGAIVGQSAVPPPVVRYV